MPVLLTATAVNHFCHQSDDNAEQRENENNNTDPDQRHGDAEKNTLAIVSYCSAQLPELRTVNIITSCVCKLFTLAFCASHR